MNKLWIFADSFGAEPNAAYDFQNRDDWILKAMISAIRKVRKYKIPLDVRIVHYGSIANIYREVESFAVNK